VVGEAIVHGTPVLSTFIDGVVGLLGDDYPGFFPAGEAHELAEFLWRCESDPEYMTQLRRSARERQARFAPEAEDRALAAAVNKVFASHTPA
jgi:glycosyltransferase involved in cell wall biosynthesis